ncbi:MAG: hypothetical protein ACTSVI_00300 [Promethearchaeota archaeon]
MNIQVALNPSRSKRLIAKGVMELVKKRIKQGYSVLVTRGSTNAYVIDEIFKYLGMKRDFPLSNFIIGEVIDDAKALWTNPRDKRVPEFLIKDKKARMVKDRNELLEIAREMKLGDVIIKGGNAIDKNGNVGVLIGNKQWAGTIGTLYPIIKAKGIDLMIPIGLEKMVMSDLESISKYSGSLRNKFCFGISCGMFIINGIVITEIDALKLLFDVDVLHMASGGLGSAQGSVVLMIESSNDDVLEKCKDFLVKEILPEKSLEPNPI